MTGFDVPARFHSVSRHGLARGFVDRREAIALFEQELAQQPADGPRLLNFFGVGGIGKSRLQHELRDRAALRTDVVCVRVDLQVPKMRRQDAVLAQLRHCLGAEHDVQLPLFDIAFSVYWQRTNPNVPMSAAELPLLSESEILADLVEAAGDTPVFGIVVNLIKGIDKMGRKAKRWKRVRDDVDLQSLDRLDAHELLDALTWFFASDLLEVLRASSRRAVVFLDAHEALWEDVTARGGRGDRDAWIRDMVSQTPGVLWIVSSRDALRWDQADPAWCEPYLRRYPVGDLAPEDRLAFLSGCGIDGAIAQAIAVASEGVPFYLNVSVDHWERIGTQREPREADFGTTKEDLLSRFVGHIPRAEEEVLKVLSVARSWDCELFEALIRRFNIAFPLSRWPDFCDYSFNRITSADRWLMHQLMRKELLRRLDPELRVEIHSAIFAFERGRVDDSALPVADRAEALREALLHAIPAGALDPGWFMETIEFFMYRGRWKVIAPALEEMEAAIDARQHPVPGSLTTLRDFAEAWILRQQGKLAEALVVFESLDLASVADWHEVIQFQVANALREAGELTRAGRIYEELWAERPAAPSHREIHTLVAIHLADFHYVQGRFRDARTILLEVLELDKADCAREVAEALRILGHVERFNESADRGLARYERAAALFSHCEDLFGQAMIQTNLAESSWPTDPGRAVTIAERAMELNHALGAQLEVGKARTACAYGRLLLGQLSDARRQVETAIDIHEQVGYRCGSAHALLCRAFVRYASDDQEGAIEDIAQATSILEDVGAYPTLRLAGAHAASLLGERSERLVQIRSTALADLQWLHDETASTRRVEMLVERLISLKR